MKSTTYAVYVILGATLTLSGCNTSKKTTSTEGASAEETGKEMTLDIAQLTQCRDIDLSKEPLPPESPSSSNVEPTPTPSTTASTSPASASAPSQNFWLPIKGKKTPNQSGLWLDNGTTDAPASDVVDTKKPVDQRFCVDENGVIFVVRQWMKGKASGVGFFPMPILRDGQISLKAIEELLKRREDLLANRLPMSDELKAKVLLSSTMLLTLLDSNADGKLAMSEFVDNQIVTGDQSVLTTVKSYLTQLFDKFATVANEGEEKTISIEKLQELLGTIFA